MLLQRNHYGTLLRRVAKCDEGCIVDRVVTGDRSAAPISMACHTLRKRTNPYGPRLRIRLIRMCVLETWN